MTISNEFAAYISELLAPLGSFQSGRFFGGLGLKSEGKQFAMVMGNQLYFCVNDTTRDAYLQANSQPFSYHAKQRRITVHKYFSVPEYLFDEPEVLRIWAQEAIVAAHSYT